MIALLVYQSTDAKGNKRVSERKKMILQRGYFVIYNDQPEILDIYVERIYKEELFVSTENG